MASVLQDNLMKSHQVHHIGFLQYIKKLNKIKLIQSVLFPTDYLYSLDPLKLESVFKYRHKICWLTVWFSNMQICGIIFAGMQALPHIRVCPVSPCEIGLATLYQQLPMSCSLNNHCHSSNVKNVYNMFLFKWFFQQVLLTDIKAKRVQSEGQISHTIAAMAGKLLSYKKGL